MVLQPSTGGANEVVRGGPISFDTPAPGAGSPLGGTAIGGWTMPTGAGGGVTTPWTPVGPVPQIDAWAVARDALYNVPLPRVRLEANPNPGLVAVPSWFWVEGYNGQPITHSETVEASHTECRLNEGESECASVDDSVTVTVRLTPERYDWTFGDGGGAIFRDRQGLGRRFSGPGSPSPVAHAYELSSLAFVRQGGFPLSLTVTFSTEFSVNGGPWESLPAVGQTYTAQHPVREAQSVVVR